MYSAEQGRLEGSGMNNLYTWCGIRLIPSFENLSCVKKRIIYHLTF